MAIDAREPKKKSSLALWGGLVVGLLVLGAIAWGVFSMMGSKKEGPKKAPKITLVAPPPPPPRRLRRLNLKKNLILLKSKKR